MPQGLLDTQMINDKSLASCPHRPAVRTSPFHGGNRGSNPLGDANYSDSPDASK